MTVINIKPNLFLSPYGEKAHFANESGEFICQVETPDEIYCAGKWVGNIVHKSQICSYCDNMIPDKKQVKILRDTEPFRKMIKRNCYNDVLANPETNPTIDDDWTDGKPLLEKEVTRKECETCGGDGKVPGWDGKGEFMCQSCDGTGEVLEGVSTMTTRDAKKSWLEWIMQILNQQTDENGLMSYYQDRPYQDIEKLKSVLNEYQNKFKNKLEKLKGD
jgi:hypothetical protein